MRIIIRNYSGCRSVVLPSTLCKVFNYKIGDSLNIKMDWNKIILSKIKEQPKEKPKPKQPKTEDELIDEALAEFSEECKEILTS